MFPTARRRLQHWLLLGCSVLMTGCAAVDGAGDAGASTARGAGGGGEVSYAEALRRASANADDPRAQLFLIDLASRIGILVRTAPGRYIPCFERAEGEPLEVVVRLDAYGYIREVRTKEDSQANRCLARELRTERLPSPPRDDWWTRIRLQGKEESGLPADPMTTPGQVQSQS